MNAMGELGILFQSLKDHSFDRVISVIHNHMGQFSVEKNVFPVNLLKKIHLFYNQCFQITLAIWNTDHTIKQRFFEMTKKDKNEEQKKKYATTLYVVGSRRSPRPGWRFVSPSPRRP